MKPLNVRQTGTTSTTQKTKAMTSLINHLQCTPDIYPWTFTVVRLTLHAWRWDNNPRDTTVVKYLGLPTKQFWMRGETSFRISPFGITMTNIAEKLHRYLASDEVIFQNLCRLKPQSVMGHITLLPSLICFVKVFCHTDITNLYVNVPHGFVQLYP